MLKKLVLAVATGLLVASAAVAQTPAPSNVNPASLDSGAEQSGAGNQPRSPGMNNHGTRSEQRGSVIQHNMRAVRHHHARAIETDGVNANVKPGSTRSGHSASGPAAGSTR
jgi:hypothetical protein